MKFLSAQFAFLMQTGTSRRNLRILRLFLLALTLMTVAYSIIFHFLMAAEGQDHTWVTGLYWTLTVMSTLGFGDITFQSDAGRAFSMLVLVTGVMFLLIVLPFTFIQFFYAPWLEEQAKRRAPRSVPDQTHGHVVITDDDPVTRALVERLKYHGRPYFVLEPDLRRALDLHDNGVPVVVGDREDMLTYQKLRVGDAALVVVSGDDYSNTNVTFTVREVSETVPIVSLARSPDSVDILQLAGASHVLELTEMLGRSLARRTVGGDVRANIIGQFGDLVIAEAPVTGTPIIGRTLADGWLRSATGLTVVGLWQRGKFEVPEPDTRISSSTVLVLAGSEAQLDRFAELTAIYNLPDAPVLVLGGGRVGRAAARALESRNIDWRIVEKDPSRVPEGSERYIVGSAADRECLRRAGIEDAATAIVTTNEDATNIYLTIYCRRLRPDIQIISRSTHERNVSTLHRAGADFVMSYAAMGASAMFNLLEQNDVVMVAEGLDVFRTPVPPRLRGLSLAETAIRQHTRCSVVAVERNGKTVINPPADFRLRSDGSDELILIGTTEAEHEFLQHYGGEVRR